MLRFILSCLIALSFIGSGPAIASMAAPAAAQADCNMPDKSAGQPTNHGKMPCCTSDCTMIGMAGLAQRDSFQPSRSGPAERAAFFMTVKKLDSLDAAAVDPPPRINLV